MVENQDLGSLLEKISSVELEHIVASTTLTRISLFSRLKLGQNSIYLSGLLCSLNEKMYETESHIAVYVDQGLMNLHTTSASGQVVKGLHCACHWSN